MTEEAFDKLAEKLRSPHDRERKEAALELLELKDPRGVDLLARLVETDLAVDVRYHARKAYYLLRDALPDHKWEVPPLELPEGISLDDLERVLADDNPRIRAEGLKLAGKIDPGSVAPLLRSALAKETHPQLRSALITFVGRVGTRHDIPSIAQFLADKDPAVRILAIEALARIGGDEALEYVIPHMQDPDGKVREEAAKVLTVLGTNEMLKLLRKLAMSPDVAYRDSAIFLLQRYKAPIAAKILAHLATVDPLPELREKARTGLEAMAKGDEGARKVWDELLAHEAAEKIDDIPSPQPGTDVPFLAQGPGRPAPPPELMVVPGLSPKLVREITKGDQAQKDAGLKQLGAQLKPEFLAFLLHRLERDQDPRILSHLLSLIGKTKAPQAYATVIKHFRYPDNRVRANAIEAAQLIDPVTTPDRVVGFLNDANNRVRANSIIVCASRPDFDPLVWVRDLAGFEDSAFRRSALFVINKLQRATFLPVLVMLLEDCELEVRQLAFLALQDYAKRGVTGAKTLAETAGKKMAKDAGVAGKFDQDFHTAMNAMRAPPPPKKSKIRTEKSAGQELGEQFLGTDGMKEAGQKVKHLQAQAKLAREKVSERLSQTTASLAAMDWKEKLPGLVSGLALVILLLLHAYGTARHVQVEAPIRLFHLGSSILAGLLALLLWRSRPGTAAFLALVLLLVPVVAVQVGFEDPLDNATSETSPADGPLTGSAAAHPGSGTAEVPSDKPPTTKVASPTIKVEGPAPTVTLLSPKRGAMINGEFAIKAKVTGKIKTVQIFLGKTCLQTFTDKDEGIFDHPGVRSDAFPFGSHVVRVRATDIYQRAVEEMLLVKFPAPLPEIKITSPTEGGVFWRDHWLAATIKGTEYGDVEFRLDDNVVRTFPSDPSNVYELPIPISTLTVGNHVFQVAVTMPDDRQATASVAFRKLIPQPSVRFLAPKDGEEVFGSVNVTLEADSGWRETAVRKVTWYVDGRLRQALATPPWEGSWDLTDVELGPHELRAIVESEIATTAEGLVRVNVIKPQFSLAIKGLRPAQVLQDDFSGTVDVVNEFPGTKIDKVVMSIDDKPFHEEAKAPYPFTIRVNEVPPGPRKLVAEVFRSDGKTFKTSLAFSVEPRGRVGLYCTAQDAQGNLLSTKELQGVKLEVKEDGNVVGSLTLQPGDAVAAWFGLIIDVSASMKSDQKLAKAKEGAAAFLDGMKPVDRAFLLKFSDRAEVVLDYTGDRTKLQQEVEYLTSKGGSALMDAVFLGVGQSGAAADRTTLVVLTDGVDENSTHTLKETIEAARRADVRIFTIGLGTQLKTPVTDGEQDLKALAQSTLGSAFFPRTAAELPEIYRTIMREIRHQTKISYLSPVSASDGKWHTLELSAPDRKDLKFLYKPGFKGK